MGPRSLECGLPTKRNFVFRIVTPKSARLPDQVSSKTLAGFLTQFSPNVIELYNFTSYIEWRCDLNSAPTLLSGSSVFFPTAKWICARIVGDDQRGTIRRKCYHNAHCFHQERNDRRTNRQTFCPMNKARFIATKLLPAAY